MVGKHRPFVPDSWDILESRAGFAGLQGLSEREILPRLGEAKARIEDLNPIHALYGGGCGVAFGGTVLAFLFGAFLGPVGILGALVAAFFLFRPAITRVAQRFIKRLAVDLAFRHSVFSPIADHLGLSYVAAPGGSVGIVRQQSTEGLFQGAFGELSEMLDQYAGQEVAVAAARASGLVELATVIHIGAADEDTRKARETGLSRLEDGFSGRHAGLVFDAFEVVRRPRHKDDGKTYPAEHALLIVLQLPRALQGTTQLRSRKVGWHQAGEAERLEEVNLESTDFAERFRVRSNDQVEARFVFTPDVIARLTELAHGEDIRATAQDGHLVFAIEGPNRFDLTSADTGLAGDAAIRLAVQQIGEMLDLVEAVSEVFGLSR